MMSEWRGEGGFKNWPVLIGCVKCGQRGGSKISKILRTSYVHGPLCAIYDEGSVNDWRQINHLCKHKAFVGFFLLTAAAVVCS